MSHHFTAKDIHERIRKHYEDRGISRQNNVVTVSAEIIEFLPCVPDHNGNMHQHFYIKINDILAGDKSLIDEKIAYVAVLYGDEEGLAEPLPNLKAGNSIIIRGKFVPARNAYKTDDNPGYSVLHFTHHPMGYIEYMGNRYE